MDFVVLLALALAPAALGYVQSSTGLVDAPLWETGNTTFAMADLDGDGNVDLVSVGDHGNPWGTGHEEGLMVWRGDGHGSWTYFHAGDLGYGGVATGDVNGDGTPDVAYGVHHNYSGTDFGDQKIEAVLGDRSLAHWTPWDDGLAGDGQVWGMFGTALADADGDGALDIASIAFGASDGLHVYLNRRDGTWSRGFGFYGGNSGLRVASGDVDGDGVLDLGATKQEGSVWRGDGEGFFTVADGNLPAPGTGNWRDGASLGDVDGDGRDDIAWCDASQNAQVWLARGAGTWASASAGLPTDAKCGLTALEDMDGDGRVDLVTLGSGGLVRVVTGNGSGTAWTVGAQFATGDSPGTAVALTTGADVDHNGRPDIVTVTEKKLGLFTYQNEVRCWRESSAATALAVRLVRPGAHRVLRAGSVAWVEWMAGVPAGPGAHVTLELSTHGASGPWIPVAADLPDNGRYQWTVPPAYAGDCRLRATIVSGTAQASSVGPSFSIVRRADALTMAFSSRDTLEWSDALARSRYDVYRGDWARFRTTGEYTQDPSAVPAAARFCGLTAAGVTDAFTPAAGAMAFYLVTAYRMVEDGVTPGVAVPMAEGPLGQDTAARMRENAHRCP